MSDLVNYSYDIQGAAGAIHGGKIGALIGGAIGGVKGKSIGSLGKGAAIGSLAGAGIGATYRMGREYLMRRKMKKLGYKFDRWGNVVIKGNDGKHHRVTLQSSKQYDRDEKGKKLYTGSPAHMSKNIAGSKLRYYKDGKVNKRKLTFRDRLSYYLDSGVDLNKRSNIRGSVHLNPKELKYNKGLMDDVVKHEIGHTMDKPYYEAVVKGKKDPYTARAHEIYADQYAVEKLGADPKRMYEGIRWMLSKSYKKVAKKAKINKRYRNDYINKNVDDNILSYRGDYLAKKAGDPLVARYTGKLK